MNLSICVQHHPSRAALLPRLGGLIYELVTDPEPDSYRSALRCYIECLRRTPERATHRLVVQDDAVPCALFMERAYERVAEHPSRLIAFFVPGTGALGQPVRDAYRRRERWVDLPRSTHFIPTVALSWPRDLIEPYLEFAIARLEAAERRGATLESDDYPVAAWCKKNDVRVLASVPSLVEHPDDEPSLFKKSKYRSGANRARVAAVFRE